MLGEGAQKGRRRWSGPLGIFGGPAGPVAAGGFPGANPSILLQGLFQLGAEAGQIGLQVFPNGVFPIPQQLPGGPLGGQPGQLEVILHECCFVSGMV
jgi:hypothetical protein